MRCVAAGVAAVLLSWATAVGANSILGPRVGDQAPEFALLGLDGERYSLEALRDGAQAVLLVFWSTECPYCHVLLPELQQRQQQLNALGVNTAAVNVGWESAAEVANYVDLQRLGFLVLNEDDKKADVAADYHLPGTPTVFLVDTSGRIVFYGHRLPDVRAHLSPSQKVGNTEP
ncbi:MAG: hypothetical protein AMJ69_01750 [Gammaproteobacteria bacterium SG8_47]|nr:MAG: hypothetical protein AMJ69_01750 [Gammaproteobacteria bacterium SG8_47]